MQYHKYECPFLVLEFVPSRAMHIDRLHQICRLRWPNIWNYDNSHGIARLKSFPRMYPHMYDRCNDLIIARQLPRDNGPADPNQRLHGHYNSILRLPTNAQGVPMDPLFSILEQHDRRHIFSSSGNGNNIPRSATRYRSRSSVVQSMRPRTPIIITPQNRQRPQHPQQQQQQPPVRHPSTSPIVSSRDPPTPVFLFSRNEGSSPGSKDDDDDQLWFPSTPTPIGGEVAPLLVTPTTMDNCTICFGDICLDDGGQPPDDPLICIDSCGHQFHLHCMEDWICRSNVNRDKFNRCIRCQRPILFKNPVVQGLFRIIIDDKYDR